MNINNIDPMAKSKAVMDAISKKQGIIGANIANVQTPGYVRRDVSFEQLLEQSNNPLETKLSTKVGENPFIVQEKGQVDVKQELVDLQRNALYYTVATRRVSSLVTTLKTVSQVGR